MSEGFGFRSLHPAVLLIYFAGGIAFGMLLFHPLILLCGWIACLLVNWHLDGGRAWRRWLVPMFSMLLFLLLINPLVSHRGRTVWFYLGDIPITYESVAYGVTMAIFLLGLLTLFVAYRIVLTESKFLYLFARISPKFALLVMMATGLIPRLRRRLADLTLIQQTRGIDVRSGTVAARARSGIRIVASLLAWTLEDALQTADSMQARGYGTGPRSAYSSYAFRARDCLTAAGLLLAAGAAAFAWWQGYGDLHIYPRLEPIALHAGDWLALGAYVLFLLLPLVWEWRDRRAWLVLNGAAR